MRASMAAGPLPVWGEPKGFGGALALTAMALKNGGQNSAAIAALAPKPGDCALEIGCGPGVALRRLVGAVGPEGFVVGVDHAPAAVHFAAHTVHRAILRGRALVMRADATNLAFKDCFFDCAMAVNSFQFWPDPVRSLREIARVLRPGGRLVITQRGSSFDQPTDFAGAAGGADRITRACAALKAGGWAIIDERCDKDGSRLVALSVIAVRPN